MTELVSLVELILGVLVVMGVGGFAIVRAVKSIATASHQITNNDVVILYSGSEEAIFRAVLAAYLRQRGCRIVEPDMRFFRYESVGLLFERYPQVDYVIDLTTESAAGERANTSMALGSALGPYSLPVEMPTVEYTIRVRIRGRRGEVHNQTLYPFRWANHSGNSVAEEMGGAIITALISADKAAPLIVTA